MVQNGEVSSCYFPIRLRCATVAAALTSPELEDALARALGRAFANARTVLPPETVVTLHESHLTTRELAADDAAQLLARINRAINAAARAQHLPLKALETHVRPASLPAQPPEESFDPARFNPLLSAYDLPSYAGGRQQVAVRATNNPFARLLQLFDRYWMVLTEFLEAAKLLKNPTTRRSELWTAINTATNRGSALEHETTRLLADLYMGKAHWAALSQEQRAHADALAKLYQQKGQAFPAQTRIAIREQQLERYIVLLPIIRARLAALDSQANAITEPEKEVLRQTFIDVGNFYLDLLSSKITSGDQLEALNALIQAIFAHLAFLDTFYAEPQRIVAYAVLRFSRKKLPELWEKLQQISLHGGIFVIGGISNTNPISGATLLPGEHAQRALAFVINRALGIEEKLELFGDLPASQEEAKGVPTPDMTAFLCASLLQLQIEVPLVALWTPLDVLKTTIGGMTAGMFGDNADKTRWLNGIAELEKAYLDEIKKQSHGNDLIARMKGWAEKEERISKEIASAVRDRQIAQLITEQVLYLFVGTAFAGGIGAWLETLTEARWLIVFGEGAALTVFNAVLAAPDTQPTTALGWAGQLATNILLAGVGRFFSSLAKGADLAEQVVNSRRVLLNLGLAATAVTATTLLQTGIQVIDRYVHNQGEDSIAQMFTINLILNALGALIGAALPRTRAGGTPRTADELVALVREAQGPTIDPQTAQAWLDLAGKSNDLMTELVEKAKEGKLSREEFEQWRQKGLALADELAAKLPPLAEVMGQTREQVSSSIAKLKAYLQHVPNPADTRGVLLLPESVSGLQHVGESITWVYDPDHQPTRLPELLQNYRDRKYDVKQLDSGGWEVRDRDANGQLVAQLLPAPPAVKGLLLPPLEELGQGPQTRQGVQLVRLQKVAPELASQLAEASIASKEARGAVVRLLRIVSNTVAADKANAWRGLSNFLHLGGDPETLASVLTFSEARQAASEHQAHVSNVLAQLADWDASAIRGLNQLYEIRPRTATRSDVHRSLEDLFSNFQSEPVILKGTFQSIDFLTSRSAPSRGLGSVLTSLMGDANQQKGAIAQLARGVQLAHQYPDAQIDFEQRVFIEVPGTNLVLERVHDIAVYRLEDVPTTAGVPMVERRLLFTEEVKEITAGRLSSRAREQLAKDIIADALARREGFSATGNAQPFLKTFRWLIRRNELETAAIERLQKSGNSSPSAQQIDQEMRAAIAAQLEKVFDRSEIKQALSKEELKSYQDAFAQDLPFVQFF
jgi:hypothetical protein